MKTLLNLTKVTMSLALLCTLVLLLGCSNLSDDKATLEFNKSLAMKAIDAWNNRTPEIIDEISSPKLKYHLNSAKVPLEVSWRSFYERNIANYPDFKLTFEDLIAEGNKVIVRLFLEGTHKTLEKKIRVADHFIARVEDGIIVEIWEVVDMGAWHSQLGYTITAPEQLQKK
jgi:predicted ester cyclase